MHYTGRHLWRHERGVRDVLAENGLQVPRALALAFQKVNHGVGFGLLLELIAALNQVLLHAVLYQIAYASFKCLQQLGLLVVELV